MWCEKCGEEYRIGEKFCKKCGVQLKQPADPAIQQSNAVQEDSMKTVLANPATPAAPISKSSAASQTSHIKVVLPIIIAVILVILCIRPLGLFSSHPMSAMKATDTITAFESEDSVIISGSMNTKHVIDAANVIYRQDSLDGSKSAILANGEEQGELWYITAKNKIKVNDGVHKMVMATGGSCVAYLTDYDESMKTAVLYLFDASTKKSTKVADEVFAETSICISPDGKSVGYAKDYDTEADEFSGYIKNGKKSPVKLGRNTLCMAISNGGKYIYYLKYNSDTDTSSFYVKSGDNETRLVSNTSSYMNGSAIAYLLNADYSQLIFNFDGRSYISKNGKEKEKLASAEIESILVPHNTQMAYWHNDIMYFVVYGVKNFNNFVANTSTFSLIHINGKEESTSLASAVSKSAVNKTGTEVFFIDHSHSLYKIKLGHGNEEKIKLAEEAADFILTSNSSRLYYIGIDSTLYYVSGSSKPKKIADDVYSSSLYLSSYGNTVFFLADYQSNSGELYYSKNGGKKSKIASDVYQTFTTPSSAFYFSSYNSSDNSFDVYRSNGGVKFKLFHSGAVSKK